MPNVAVTDETQNGIKAEQIILIQHSGVRLPDRIVSPWLIKARIVPTIMATLKARFATGLLKKIGSAMLNLFIVFSLIRQEQ
jgi:hypothetical protein